MLEKFIAGLMKLVSGIIIAFVGFTFILLSYNLLVKPVLIIYGQVGLLQGLITFVLEVVFVGFIIILVYVFKEK